MGCYTNLMRKILAWIIGIAVTAVLFLIGLKLSELFGLETYIDFPETVVISHRYYDEEVDGAFTAVGSAINFISIMIGIRCGMAFFYGSWDKWLSHKDNVSYYCWLIGLGLYGLGGTIINALFGDSDEWYLNILSMACELGLVGFLALGLWKYYKEQTSPKDAMDI